MAVEVRAGRHLESVLAEEELEVEVALDLAVVDEVDGEDAAA